MIFASDNWAGAHPKVTAALAAHGGGFATAYGNGELDKAIYAKFNEIFERDVAVFFVGTGTAANSLALTLASKPGGVGFYHREAHAIEDECGAPEYFTGGTRLCPVDGALGRMDPAKLERAIAHYPAEVLHSGRPVAVSITQSSAQWDAAAISKSPIKRSSSSGCRKTLSSSSTRSPSGDVAARVAIGAATSQARPRT